MLWITLREMRAHARRLGAQSLELTAGRLVDCFTPRRDDFL